jgi:hypothetical protein
MIFSLQNRTVRITAGAKPRNSCISLLMRLEILPLPCEHMFSIMNFVTNNHENFHTNSAIHNVNIRNAGHLHQPFMFSEKCIGLLF